MIIETCPRCKGERGLVEVIDEIHNVIDKVECSICNGQGVIRQLEWKDIGKGDIKPEFFLLNRARCEALRKFLYDNGYISYEFHEVIHNIKNDLDKFLGE